MTIRRRELLLSLTSLAGLAGLSLPRRADARDRVVDRRLELWRSYAATTQNLVASLTTIRHSSLLDGDEPLRLRGTLVFVAPDRLLLHDDDAAGSTTLIDGERASILANAPDARSAADLQPTPARRWLAARLLGAFAPPPSDPERPTALEADARLSRPRGAGIRLTVLPRRESIVRATFRSITISLAPTSGAVDRLEIAESAGDRLILELADHQRNLEAPALAELLRGIDPRHT
ncbi:MAG: hypothetical protein R3A79_07835 [Nannocystaceae bacterium]